MLGASTEIRTSNFDGFILNFLIRSKGGKHFVSCGLILLLFGLPYGRGHHNISALRDLAEALKSRGRAGNRLSLSYTLSFLLPWFPHMCLNGNCEYLASVHNRI